MRQLVVAFSLLVFGCGGVKAQSDANVDATFDSDAGADATDSSSDANSETDTGNDSRLSGDVTKDARPDIILDIAMDGRADGTSDAFSCCPLFDGDGSDCNFYGGSPSIPGMLLSCYRICDGPVSGLKPGAIYCYDYNDCPVSGPLSDCVRYVDAGPEGGD